jgi:hypothetical protein
MSLTARQLNRATLSRQLLLEREPVDVVEGVRRVGALQAQEAASPYLALWNRLAGFDPDDLDAAFATREVVKASLVRLTLHAVHADDYPAFHHAMVPSLRASRLRDSRYRDTGLSDADADAFLPHLLQFLDRPRTGAEVEELIEERLGARHPRLWWALRTFAPLHHAPTGAPWSFRSPSAFVAAGTAAAPAAPTEPTTRSGPAEAAAPLPHEEAVQRLVLRYLEAFGPASVRDVAQFTMLRHPVLRRTLETMAAEVEELDGPDGATLFDVPGAPRGSEDAPAPPRLLPMWDSVLLAYADRSRVIPAEHRPLVIRRNGDVLPTLLVDGYVAGVWRPVDGSIEVTAFHRLGDEVWDALAVEAASLAALLDERDPAVYRRYARWWRDLPGEQVRLLPG